MRTTLELDTISTLLAGRHENPFEVLGPHEVQGQGEQVTAVRALLPHSQQAWIVDKAHGITRPMRRIHPAGLFEALCPRDETLCGASYQIRTHDPQGQPTTMHDPYAFPPIWSDYDRYLFGEGRHWRAYDLMGAHPRTVDGVSGVNFSVWAPNATGVSVIGDFNRWDRRMHPMRKHIPAGIWELFIPDLKPGTIYKYALQLQQGLAERADPYGFGTEQPPKTASVVSDLSTFAWGDEQWLEQRAARNGLDAPLSIYEVHLGSWKRGNHGHDWLDYRELAHQLVEYCHQLGFTHVELMPISEHPYTGSWGYQTLGYFAATSRYGGPDDFMYFVDYCHRNDIGVLIDWVPAHFPRDEHGLRQFDGTALYEHADPRQGEHPDWGTLIFNYDRTEVRNFLLSNALFWLDKYHIDGLRVDAVASMLYLDYSREEGDWIPNQYGGRENLGAISLLKDFNEQVHGQFPGVLTIAEESTAFTGVSRPTYDGGLGFSLKWNMGWMNDTLQYMRKDPIHRRYHQNDLTFSLIYAFTENFCLPLSHDEVVHGKGSLLDQMAGGEDLWQRFANLRLLFTYMWTHPGKKLLFMGGDIGQWNEWNCDQSLQWDLLQWDSHRGMQRLVTDLNALYRREPALHQVDFEPEGFEWIDCHNEQDCVLAYLRRGRDPQDYLLIGCNFTPVPRLQYRLGVTEQCHFAEVFNSDSTHYDGSNMGNGGGIQATSVGAQQRPYSVQVTLPPLSVIVLKPQRG